MPNHSKNFFIWIAAFVALVVSYNLLSNKISGGTYKAITFSEFISRVNEDQVSTVDIKGHFLSGELVDGTHYSTLTTDYPNLIDKLESHKVKFQVLPKEGMMDLILGIFFTWLPILLLGGLIITLMRHLQSGSGKAMGFGKSRARLLTEKSGKITFNDVAGIEEAKDELAEIVDFLRDPGKFQSLGGKIPKGCLLIGSPGTGKTLLARAIAGEANVPFFTISGSDFVEMFVGVGASRVRDMFEQAKKSAPCIIFIDEIDAVGRHRGIGMGGGNDEREQTLNQLLVEMDGFESNEGVIIIAATNRPDVLDPALLRPGRFDRQIQVPAPDLLGREQILKVHLKKVVTGPDVEPKIIARGTPGFAGAELANLVNEAALLAARNNKKVVTMNELESAKDKVMMGAERRSMVMSEEEKKLTAYHEGGHAIVALNCLASDPIHKATIIPRGRALGLVMRLPLTDKFSVTREKLHSDIAVAMGGRVAEELIFGYDKVTSGASSDIQQATKMARAMVMEWGMSDKVGPLYYGGDSQDLYGHGGNQKARSEAVAETIDDEIRLFVEEGYKKARSILTENLEHLHIVAKSLLEFETLTGDEIRDLIAGKTITRKTSENDEVIKSNLPQSGSTKDSDTVNNSKNE